MILLIGSGNRCKPVWGGEFSSRPVTLDIDPGVRPTVVWDLNKLPLPFGDSAFDEIHCVDVLEHTGTQGDYKFFFAQWDEFWRILRHGGTFNCCAPRADSVWAWGDPGHTRVIVEQQLSYLHRPAYAQVGTTPMTDYRSIFVSDWDLSRCKYEEHHMLFQLTAIKEPR